MMRAMHVMRKKIKFFSLWDFFFSRLLRHKDTRTWWYRWHRFCEEWKRFIIGVYWSVSWAYTNFFFADDHNIFSGSQDKKKWRLKDKTKCETQCTSAHTFKCHQGSNFTFVWKGKKTRVQQVRSRSAWKVLLKKCGITSFRRFLKYFGQ